MLVVIVMLAWLHNVTHYPDPPDAEYPVFEKDFVNREAYLRFLEQVEEPYSSCGQLRDTTVKILKGYAMSEPCLIHCTKRLV